MYKHYFRCATCGRHVVTLTDESVPWQPAKMHGEALKNGAAPATPNDAAGDGCLGS